MKIETANILSKSLFCTHREKIKANILKIKARRRIEVGPYVTLYFENSATVQWQIQEMLRIENDPHLEDELDAYNPLIPSSEELIATMMIEINDPILRNNQLYKLRDIERCAFLIIDGQHIKAEPLEDEANRVTPDGKTSSIHFIRFHVNKTDFVNSTIRSLIIRHPNYSYQRNLTSAEFNELFETNAELFGNFRDF